MSNQKLVRDILISIPVAILYVYFINKVNDMLIHEEDEFNDKIKKTIVFSFIAAICGYMLAKTFIVGGFLLAIILLSYKF